MKVNEPRRQKLERRNCWEQVKHGKPSAVPHCGVIIPLTVSNLSCLLDDQLVVIGFSTSSLISVCVYTYFESQVDNSPSLFFVIQATQASLAQKMLTSAKIPRVRTVPPASTFEVAFTASALQVTVATSVSRIPAAPATPACTMLPVSVNQGE